LGELPITETGTIPVFNQQGTTSL